MEKNLAARKLAVSKFSSFVVSSLRKGTKKEKEKVKEKKEKRRKKESKTERNEGEKEDFDRGKERRKLSSGVASINEEWDTEAVERAAMVVPSYTSPDHIVVARRIVLACRPVCTNAWVAKVSLLQKLSCTEHRSNGN